MKMFKWEEKFNQPGYWISKEDAEKIHMRSLGIYTPKAYYKWKKKNNFNKIINFIETKELQNEN